MASKKKTPPAQSDTTTVRVGRDVHRRAKIYAAHQDMEVQDVLTEALDEYLKKRGA